MVKYQGTLWSYCCVPSKFCNAIKVFVFFQVSTWKKQYDAAAHTDIPAMNELAEWLANNLPPDDDEEALIHGDFRIDNIIFHPTEVFEMYLYILCFVLHYWLFTG